jgi:hypothetical protein
VSGLARKSNTKKEKQLVGTEETSFKLGALHLEYVHQQSGSGEKVFHATEVSGSVTPSNN